MIRLFTRGIKAAIHPVMEAVTQTIKVRIRTVYGVERIYPACPKAELFTALLEQETFTRADISIIKQLGFDIEVERNFVVL